MIKKGFLYIFIPVLLNAFVPAEYLMAESGSGFDTEAFIDSSERNKIIELSVLECIALAINNNSEIKIKKLEPIVAKYEIKKKEGVFEPTLNASYSYEEKNEPSTGSGNLENITRMPFPGL